MLKYTQDMFQFDMPIHVFIRNCSLIDAQDAII